MLSSGASRAKSTIKRNLPIVVAGYRALRRLPGLQGGGYRRRLNAYLRQQTGSLVASGPFAGMRLVEGSSWGDGDVAPKLLGTYEEELHPWFERFRGRNYGAIIDLGCAEGYYAIGLARLFPAAAIHAFDTDRAAITVARRAANANEVADRIVFGGFCDWSMLEALSVRPEPLLIISDCEGYEADLFGAADRQALKRSDLIIECHEKIRPHSTEAITKALVATHVIRRIDAIGRNPNQFAFLADVHEADRWLAVCENRPYCSHWLVCESRAEASRDEVTHVPA